MPINGILLPIAARVRFEHGLLFFRMTINEVSGQIVDAAMKVYLELGDVKLGLLLNFNVVRMKDGVKRMANSL